MAVDFSDLRFKLESLDIWSVQDKKGEAAALVENIDGESLRALSLMAAKRHTVKHIPDGTKTFDLLENVIIGLHSDDCVDLAKQAISIAPDWILRTFLLASINRFNTVDQLAIRQLITQREKEAGEEVVELSQEELAAAQAAAIEAAAHAAAVERGEINPDGEEPQVDTKRRGRAKKERPVRGAKKAPVSKTAAKTGSAKTNADKSAAAKPKRNWLTGK
jgi:hypothetical protein